MTCDRARKLFGAYWDDDITQAEREWLDAHLGACPTCRTEYDALARTLELVASLPRVEPAPDLVERTVDSARRAAAAPDRLPERSRAWVPVTAAAAAAVLVVTLVLPWAGDRFGGPREEAPVAVIDMPVAMPTRVTPTPAEDPASGPPASADSAAQGELLAGAVGDSLFDHAEDMEFILDAVAVRRGRAHPLPLTRAADGVQLEQAVITF